jgi:hypothetical protein
MLTREQSKTFTIARFFRTVIYVILVVSAATRASNASEPAAGTTAATSKSSAATAAGNNASRISFRLPRKVKPTYYEVRIVPDDTSGSNNNAESADLSPAGFEGWTRITVDCVQKTSAVVLHASNLTLDDDGDYGVVVTRREAAGSANVPIKSKTFVPELEFLELRFGEKLQPGATYQLEFKFRGSISDATKDKRAAFGLISTTVEDRIDRRTK